MAKAKYEISSRRNNLSEEWTVIETTVDEKLAKDYALINRDLGWQKYLIRKA